MTARTMVGVDVGGTFTDLFIFDADTGQFRTGKVLSNRGDEAVGFLEGLRQFGAVAGLVSIVHGTTVGFRDALEMRRRDRRHTWGLTGDFVPGAWGHQLVDALQPSDLSVEKIAYSAFCIRAALWRMAVWPPPCATSTSWCSAMAVRRSPVRCTPHNHRRLAPGQPNRDNC